MDSNNISIQLWSVQEAMKDNYMGTLEKIAEMGYSGVEFAGFGGFSAEQIKEKLDQTGLKPSGAHVPIEELRSNIDSVIEYHKKIGNRNIICPGAGFESRAEAEALREEFLGFNEKLSENGMIFAYHNHAHEIVDFDGECALDIMLGDERLNYELDTFWTEYAKADTVRYLKKIGKRCPFVHLKDMNEKNESTIYGTGILNNKEIIKAAREYCNPQWFVIEWEAFGSCDCLYAASESYKNLIKLMEGF